MKLAESLNVICQRAEDGLADTVKPRLEQAGADCEKISVIDEKILIVPGADWDNRLGHNEQCERSSHQRQEIRRHIGHGFDSLYERQNGPERAKIED